MYLEGIETKEAIFIDIATVLVLLGYYMDRR